MSRKSSGKAKKRAADRVPPSPARPSSPASSPAAVQLAPAADTATTRLVSVDVLRGFTMLWIVGGDNIVGALARISESQGPLIKWLGGAAGYQMSHAPWEGFRFYDLIFPLFLFVTGVSIVLSLGRRVAGEGRRAAYRRVARRALVLYLLGVIVAGGVAQAWPEVRLMGVLQRIGLCYLAASLLYLHLSARALAGVVVAILVGYWALLTFAPVPGLGHPSLTPEASLARWLDEHYLPGKRWYGAWDPEGLLSTLPAIASCLMGVLAGLVLTSPRLLPARRSALLVGAGLACLVAGYLLGLQHPIVKKLWTASYVLVAGGWSLVLLGLLHDVADQRGWRRGSGWLVWIGANAITLYLVQNLVGFEGIAKRLAGGDIRAFFDTNLVDGSGLLVIRLVALGLAIWLARYLYRRGIFLRV